MSANEEEHEARPHNILAEDGDGDDDGVDTCSESSTLGDNSRENAISKWRKDMFGDCALIEIIHLHECLRGALKALERDVNVLSQSILKKKKGDELSELERRVAGRFKVIWSVFRAHSSAEDEFIWPALRRKTKGAVKGSPKYKPYDDRPYQAFQMGTHNQSQNHLAHSLMQGQHTTRDRRQCSDMAMSGSNLNKPLGAVVSNLPSLKHPDQGEPQPLQLPRWHELVENNDVIEQDEYEEDHADEERMFSMMDNLLSKLRSGLIQKDEDKQTSSSPSLQSCADSSLSSESVDDTMHQLDVLTKKLSQHLMQHLEKEEVQCMPLVVKHLSKPEIYDLVGKIMGKRSSDTIAQIMTMAVQNLNDEDREEMVKYMKQAMAGTFFDRWLSMSGWMEDKPLKKSGEESSTISKKRLLDDSTQTSPSLQQHQQLKQSKTDGGANVLQKYPTETAVLSSLGRLDSNLEDTVVASGITSQAELEKHIRAIATNQNLTPLQKNITIQSLRDSVWKSNQRIKQNLLKQSPGGNSAHGGTSMAVSSPCQCHSTSVTSNANATAVSTMFTPVRRATPPSIYFKKNGDGKIVQILPSNESDVVPLFSSSELAPTFHDGARGSVLGCPHYACACKLRHPSSGRLYTCRLCCEQVREMPSKDQDVPLDRYAVTEVMCMKCNALQPADDRCMNPSCESQGKPFAKYFCRICHLYDDRPRPIFHCPYCNICRMGLGIGIDFFHCMRCNACVSMKEKEHRCIPQKLQGSCPICYESLFQSTEPLRGVQCGHVMHLSCFVQYRRGQRYTCPLCMRSMEDMSDYFALLDAAVRMQPMPAAFLSTVSNIYCQDCSKSGQCQYHFVGQKCPHCGSYNTRELGRIDMAASLAS